MKTTRTKAGEIERKWYIVDAADKRLGRLASFVTKYLMGKNKVTYSPDVDNGDGVIIINASKMTFSGNKLKDKKYYTHSRYIGSIKEKNLEEMMEKHPDRVVKLAVKRMLPKNTLGRTMLARLRVYAGKEHGHDAQKPESLTF